MSVKTRFKLLLLCAVSALTLFIAGCIGEQTAEEFLKKEGMLDQSITYYANGGYFGDNQETVYKSMYYAEDAPVISDFSKLSDNNLTRRGYTFDDWYLAELDADGNPVKDEGGNFKITDTNANLSDKRIQKNEHLFVCAGWIMDVRLSIKVAGVAVKTTDGRTIAVGEEISTAIFNKDNKVSLKYDLVESQTQTLLQYYEDADCTKPITGSYAKPDGVESPVVYAKFIDGKYTIVRTAAEAAQMLNSSSEEGSYYLFNASGEKTFDMTGRVISLRTGDFNIKIFGNDFTLENIKLPTSTVSNGNNYSMFGNFTEKAAISDLTIKNLSLEATVRTRAQVHLYLLCKGAADGATFKNFVVDGASLTVTVPANSTVVNIPKVGDEFVKTNWLLGGVSGTDGETDRAFLQKFTGLTVKNEQLNVISK